MKKMKEERPTSGQGSNKEWLKAVNKNVSDKSRRIKVSARIDRPIIEEIEEKHENRSEGIRKALKKEYGKGEA